jgi:uncharacterized protein (DUF1501 family)
MAISRREFTRLIAGASGLAVAAQLGNAASVAQVSSGFKAMVGVFLFGGNDAWNMVAPTDSRYSAYASARGAIALPQTSLMGLSGTPFGLHPSFTPLKTAWDEGALNVVLNAGSLFQPLTKTLYQTRTDLRPLNLMSHADEQDHWQGMNMRDENTSGFMGRIADKMAAATMPPLISIAGANLALIGDRASPLILPSTGSIVRSGYNAASTDNAVKARQAALAEFENGTGYGQPTDLTARGMSSAYGQAVQANSIVSAATSPVDQYFVNPANGATLTSDIARQLQRTARMIAARDSMGHSKQVYFVSQGGYDTHVNQVNNGQTATGAQANLYTDLALALAGFYNAMKGIGLADNVTAFTMSDFGRVYKANAQLGTDHAWGSNHLVVGGAVKAQTVHGAYPEPTLGGPDDIGTDGRWIPTIAVEEYVGAVAGWWGVSSADMPYVFPNWSTWNGGGRGPVPLFG